MRRGLVDLRADSARFGRILPVGWEIRALDGRRSVWLVAYARPAGIARRRGRGAAEADLSILGQRIVVLSTVARRN
jgi:hypothetical protein